MALTHGVYTVFLAALNMKTVYTPWVTAMSAAFTGTEWVNSGPSQLSKKNTDWFRKSWTLSNIHTSDKLEIFFGGRVFSDSQPRSQDAILFTMAKALCTGQRHYNRIHYNYHIWSSLQNRVSDRASECFLAPRYTRFIAFTSKNEESSNPLRFHKIADDYLVDSSFLSITTTGQSSDQIT